MSILQQVATSRLGKARRGPVELRGGKVVAAVELDPGVMWFDDREELLSLALASRQALIAYDDAVREHGCGVPLQPRPYVPPAPATAPGAPATAGQVRRPGAHAAPPVNGGTGPAGMPRQQMPAPPSPVFRLVGPAPHPQLDAALAESGRRRSHSSRDGRRRVPVKVIWRRLQQRWRGVSQSPPVLQGRT